MTAPLTSDPNLVKALELLRDNAYLTYCRISDDRLCQGQEIKLEKGWFQKPELDAHKSAAEWLGKHRAYAQVLELLQGKEAA